MEIIVRPSNSSNEKAVKPVSKSSEDKSREEEYSSFRFVAPGVIDVDFEELRSFPEHYTVTTYDSKGNIVVLEYSPRTINIKA